MSTSIGASRSSPLLRATSRGIICPRCHAFRPTYSLPLRSITTVSHDTEPADIPTPLLNSSHYRAHPRTRKEIAAARRIESIPLPPREPPSPSPPAPNLALPPKRTVPFSPVSKVIDAVTDPSIQTLLPLLAVQRPHYIILHVHSRPFLVTQGDKITLPFLIHGLRPGDVLRLNRASLLGSRDYTLKAPALTRRTRDQAALGLNTRREKWIDERLFLCRAVVLGEEVEPLRVKLKKKQRNRRTKHVYSQHHYTVLRISELEVFGPEVLVPGSESAEVIKGADVGTVAKEEMEEGLRKSLGDGREIGAKSVEWKPDESLRKGEDKLKTGEDAKDEITEQLINQLRAL